MSGSNTPRSPVDAALRSPLVAPPNPLAQAVLDALSDDALEALADRLAPRIAARLSASEDGWLDAKGAADYLGLPSVNALHRLSSERRIPCSQDREGGKLYFRRSALDRWRSEQER